MRTYSRSRERLEGLIATRGPGPWTISDVRDAGWTVAHIRRAVARGWLVRPRRGSLALAGSLDLPVSDPVSELRRRATVLLARYVGAVVSHVSAATLHGLWLPRPAGPDVHLISPRRPDREQPGVRVHGSRLPRSQIVDLGGLPVTSVARTAVDVARGRSIEDAVLVLDSAARTLAAQAGVDLRRLRHDLELRRVWTAAARAELWEAYLSVRRWPFTVVVRTAIPLVDPASESPLESRSRIRIASSNLPEPAIARTLVGASGTAYTVDFLWDEYRVIGEADGTGKYGDDPVTVRARLRAERRRQRDLEDAGWTFVRWESTEPWQAIIARIRRTLLSHGWTPASLG